MDPGGHLPRRWIMLLFAVALALRLGAHLARPASGPRGYEYYAEMALHLADEGRLYRTMPFGQGDRFAIRTPGYPVALAALAPVATDVRIRAASLGALCGAFSTMFAAMLGTRMFGRRAGLAAGACVALWPHAVLHDTALQDTALYTMLFLALVLVAHRLSVDERRLDLVSAAGAGLLGAAAVLVRVALLPTVVVLLAWPLIAGGDRRRSLLLLLVGAVTLNAGLLPWRLRNARVVYDAVLTSDTGRSLWLGNNARVFDVYPRQSIDRAEERAWTALPEPTRAEIRSLSHDELAQDAWFRAEALAWIRANPGAAAIGAVRKAWAGFSPWFNPRGSDLKQLVHALSYGSVALLAVAAIIRLRVRRRGAGLVVACCALFAAQSAVFFGHSSYRAYLDPLLIVLAASWLAPRRASIAGDQPA
jgi:4-amino-4-deoxy-L-arabinose transferase-like glycosyltransferase